MHAATEVIAMMASFTSFVVLLPHAARIWKYRDDPAQLRGISFGSQLIGLASTVLWTSYAVLTAQVWVGAPHLVNGPITVATILVLVRARRAATAALDAIATTLGNAPADALGDDLRKDHRDDLGHDLREDQRDGRGRDLRDSLAHGLEVPDDARELTAAV